MALILEDGTGKSNADSFTDLATARAIAANYGVTLPTIDTDAEVALRQGCQYLMLSESRFSGSRVSASQALPWPRVGASNQYGFEYSETDIPVQLSYAQVFAAAEFAKGTDVRATDDGKAIASEAVSGAVSVSYFDNGKTGESVIITRAMDALKPLLTGSNDGISFRVYRG